MEALKALADEYNIRDPRKLYQFAKSKGQEITAKQAAAALRNSTQRELLAPQRQFYKGHFAASAPGDQIQADLIDWGAHNRKAKRGGGQYAVVASDVFTRVVAAQPVANKRAETVEKALDYIFHTHMFPEDAAVITTDKGAEWADVGKYHPDNGVELIHRTKDVRDRNGLSIVDSAIRNIKRDLAAEVGKEKGRTWGNHIQKVVKDLNEKPSSAVFGPPQRVAQNAGQEFKVLQQQADNYALNDRNIKKRAIAVIEAGAFRAPVGDGRAANVTYGPAQKYEGHDTQYVFSRGHMAALKRGQNGEDHEYLLKQVRPAYAEGKMQSTLTFDVANRKIGTKAAPLLRTQALQLENLIHKSGPVPVDQLEKKLSGLRKLTQKYKNLTADNWITQTFKKKFVIEDGLVKLRPPKPPPARAPPKARQMLRV
jgi:hypothetical protein